MKRTILLLLLLILTSCAAGNDFGATPTPLPTAAPLPSQPRTDPNPELQGVAKEIDDFISVVFPMALVGGAFSVIVVLALYFLIRKIRNLKNRRKRKHRRNIYW